MAVAGVIADSARRQIPVTWAALANDTRYGEQTLRSVVDLVKYKLFGDVVLPELEETTYDPIVVDYAGKLAAISIIPAGADYWTTARTTETTAGDRNETVSYVDRVEKLWKLYGVLVTDTKAMLPEIKAILGIKLKLRVKTAKIGYRDAENPNFVTSNPLDFARTYEPLTASDV